jgi:hypothetical protein
LRREEDVADKGPQAEKPEGKDQEVTHLPSIIVFSRLSAGVLRLCRM